jgi:hypothetical protein
MPLTTAAIEAQPHTGVQPLIVSYGVGVDSTALLVAMQQRGIRPDAIIFSDTKAEKRETYAYIPVINAWLRRVGFPELTIVAYVPESAPYDSMEGKWLANETLPSLAYGGHSCAQVFKHGPMDKWIKAWDVAQAAWASGVKVVRAIGYDNSDRDCARRAKADRSVGNKTAREIAERAIAVAKAIDAGRKPRAVGLRDDQRWDFWYPLQDWGIDRIECLRLIESAGLPLPMKSACYFCPASKKTEIVWLRDHHQDLFQRALRIEANALNGKNHAPEKKCSTKGLGRTFAWATLAEASADTIVDDDKEIDRP